jgi:hypothetical protein
LGTAITLVGAYQHKNVDLHGYILSGKRELIAQNQALERADKGKFGLMENGLKSGHYSCYPERPGGGKNV